MIDFDKLDEHKDAFNEGDIAFCCLGTTRGKSGADGFVKVDYDYVVNTAKILKDNGVCKDYHLVSSKGNLIHQRICFSILLEVIYQATI